MRDKEPPAYLVSAVGKLVYDIVGRTWMASIPWLSLRDQEPPAYLVSTVLARLVYSTCRENMDSQLSWAICEIKNLQHIRLNSIGQVS